MTKMTLTTVVTVCGGHSACITLILRIFLLHMAANSACCYPAGATTTDAASRTTALPYSVSALNASYGITSSEIAPSKSPTYKDAPVIQLDDCKAFFYKLQTDYHFNDMSTTELLDENRHRVASDSLVHFNSTSQEIHGVLTQKSHSTSKKLSHRYILRGKASRGQANEVHFRLSLPPFIRRWNYKVRLRLGTQMQPERRATDIIIDVMRKISDFLQDKSLSHIYPISYENGKNNVIFDWSYHSLDYPACSREVINEISNKMFHANGKVKQSFKDKLSPEYRLLEASETRSELCLVSISNNIDDAEFRKIFRRSLGSVQTSRRRPRRSVQNNTAPVLNDQIGVLNASYCNLFLYQVPAKLFSDKEDGSVRNLTLTLHTKDGANVGQDSWLQMQSTLQTLYGYLKASDAVLADADNLIHYKLVATDSGGLAQSVSFSVKIPLSAPKIFYKIELTVNNFENQSEPNLKEEIFIAIKIVNYFEDSFFWGINILSFERNLTASRITFGWTNCTLTGDTCPEKEIQTLIGKVVTQDGQPNAQFVTKLQPQYIVYNIQATRVGQCASNQSSSYLSASLATPVYSNSPRINSVIPELTVTTTAYFTYQVSSSTFYDSIDGYTRSLSLELRTASNIVLSRSSWLQFDTKTQTMYGLLTSTQFSSAYVQTFQYLLVATNSRGFSTQLGINFKGSRQTVSFGAQFSISGRDNSAYTTNDVKVLSQTLLKLRAYLPLTMNNTVEVVSFQRTLVGQQRLFTLVYSNVTITTSNCYVLTQLTPLLESQGNLIHPSLTTALTPDVVADRIDIKRLGACAVSTTSIIKPTAGSLYPELRKPVPLLNIQAGLYFYYQISSDTFYDAADGNTAKLSLTLTFIDGRSLNDSSWVQFDSLYQHMYGLLAASQQTNRPYQDFSFKLSARNSLGYVTTQIIRIRSAYILSNLGVEFTLQGREYSTIQLNEIQLQNFLVTKLKQYLSITSNATIIITSFQRQSQAGSLFKMRWTDSRLTSTNCNLKLLRDIESKVVSSPAVIHRNLIERFTPSTVLYDAGISYYGTCSNTGSSITVLPSPSVNAPRYLSILSPINATSGILFNFQIPRDTFEDSIDGATRNLKLSLVNIDGTQLSSSSLVHFNTTGQTLHGLILTSNLQGSNARMFTYSLVATNSRNYKTAVSISIYVSKYQQSIGLSIDTSLVVRYSTSTTNLQLMQYFLNQINSYLQSSVIANIVVTSFNRKTSPAHELIVTWTYSVINGASCNLTFLSGLTSLLQTENGLPNTEFVRAMSPGFSLYSVVAKRLETCRGFETLTTIHMQMSTQQSSLVGFSKHTQHLSSTASVPIDHPPRVTSKLLPLFAYFCTSFSYMIPADLFFDKEQGDARKLKLRLEMPDGNGVNSSSWLQFSQSSQSIYGILKVDDFYKKPIGGYLYYLTAVDNKGQTARTDFTITIPTFPPQINHVITMQFNRVFDTSVPDVNEQLLIVTKILNYFNDGNANKINVISYRTSDIDNTATIAWSNCSLAYTPCPHTQLHSMLNKMIATTGGITGNFRNALKPHVINTIRAEKLHPCNQSTATESSYFQTTIKPSPSIGAPPTLENPIPQINITWCAPFEYRIPAHTFSDFVDGTTRNLSLKLLQTNQSPILVNSWLKFDNLTQVIYGYPQQSDLSSYQVSNYLLVATNTMKLSASQTISIKIIKAKPNPNHQLRLTTTAYLNSKMADVDVRIFIWRRMKTYLKSNATEFISFNSFTRASGLPSQLHFTFSNCSFPEDKCDKNAFDSIVSKIFASADVINSNFIMAFSPEIVITAVKIENLGLCTQLASSLYASPSSAYQQSTSVVSTQVTPTKNLPPLVLRAIGPLTVDVCKVFSLTIPEGTFYDVEDGLTRQLKLALTDLNNTALGSDSWLIFDASLQTLTGITMESKIQTATLDFLLTATDKGGLTASTTINFKIQSANRPVFLSVNTSATGYFSHTASNNDILIQFIAKLTSYLGYSQENSIRMLSFSRTASSVSQLHFSWTPCDARYVCNTTAVQELQSKLLITSSRVNPDLGIALGPKIIVTEVKMNSSASCPMSTATATSTIAADTSTVRHTSSSTASSSVASFNTPPRFVKNAPLIEASLCSPFSVTLPADMCFDPEDGFSGTSIVIAYKNGTALSSASMLQYNQQNRTIYGIVKQSDLNTDKQIKDEYLVKCVDTKGLDAMQSLNINITNTKFNDTYTVTFYTYMFSISSQSDVDIQLLWIKKLQNYLQSPISNKMHFVYFKRLSNIQARFAVQLCNLDTCNTAAVAEVQAKTFSTIPLLNSQFVASMVPEFSLVSAEFAFPSLNTTCPIISPTYSSPSFATSRTATSTVLISSTAVYDSPPTVGKSIPIINITLCNPFSYRIPENTFYDSEDGYTSNLTTSLQNMNGSVVDRSSWIQYDATTLTIYGFLTQDAITNSRDASYQLAAKDRSGNIARLAVNLRSLSAYKVASHSFVTQANVYTNFSNDVRIRSKLESKIKSFFGSQLNSGLMFVNFARFDGATPKVVFAWSACSLAEKCDHKSVKAIEAKMLFYGSILNFEFIAALAPDFIVTKVQLTENPSCLTSSSEMTTFSIHQSLSRVASYSSAFAHTTGRSMSTAYNKYSTTPVLLQTSIVTSYASSFSAGGIQASTAYSSAISSAAPSIPKVLKSLPIVPAGLCGFVSYKIPADTFFDASQGGTASLRLSARLANQQAIPEDSWINFVENSQTFLGQATVKDYQNQPQGGYKYIVRATNANSYYAETHITFKIIMGATQVNHNISMSIEEPATSSASNVDTVSLLRSHIGSYFNDSTTQNIGVLEYQRNTRLSRVMNITWYNCTIANTSCDRKGIEEYLSQIVGSSNAPVSSFVAAFSSYQVRSVTAMIAESCLQSSSSYGLHQTYTTLKDSTTYTTWTYSRITAQSTRHSSSVVTSISAAPSHHSITASSTSSVTTPNTPPRPKGPLTIKLTHCNAFRFKIPNDTFTDKEDGGAESLLLTLLDQDSAGPSCNFTLQLNQTSKEIYGIVVASDWMTSRLMLLQATDSGGLTSTTTVTFQPEPQPSNITFSVIFTLKPQKSCHREILQYLYRKLSDYFPSESFVFLSISSTASARQMTVEWAFCTSFTIRCNFTKIASTSKKILQNSLPNENLLDLLAPEILLLNATMNTSSKCQPDTRMVYLNITYCNSLNYSLHEAIFKSGSESFGSSSEELRYLLEPYGQQLLPWIKFDRNTTTLLAYPVYNSLKKSNTTRMLLTVKTQTLVVSTIILQLNHPVSTIINQNFVIYFKILSYLKSSTHGYDLLNSVMTKLSTFMKIPKHELLILDYNRTSIFPETLHISIMPCFSQYRCNTTKANAMVSSLIINTNYPTYSLVQFMLPEFVMQSASETRASSCINKPPIKNKDVMNITVTLCTELNSPVENNTFFDQEDQTSQGLAYELLDKDGRKIGLHSWVQFDKNRRIIYGVPTRKDLINQPKSGYLFILKALDTGGLSSNITVNITIKGKTDKSVYEVMFVFRSFAAQETRNTDILLDILGKIRRYFGDLNSKFIGVISFTRAIDLNGMDNLVWTNCSLSNESCDITTIEAISQKLVTNNGTMNDGIVNALGSNYSASRINEERSGVCRNMTNSAPKINASISLLNASSCTHLRYRIPEYTVQDAEDGNTRALLVSLRTSKGSFLGPSSWIQLDTADQTVYAIATYDVIRNQPISGYTFLLYAQDSSGAEISAPVQIKWSGNATERHLVNIIMRTTIGAASSDLSRLRQFLSKTAKCLNTTEDTLSVAYFNKMKDDSFNISVYNQCGNTSASCDKASIQDLYMRLTLSSGTQRSKYSSCMASEITIINVTLSYATSCTAVPRNTPPRVNRTLPVLNMTICSALYYKIPNDTFVDADMDKLTLNLLQSNGQPLLDTDFLQFNKSSATIYGLIARSSEQRQYNDRMYILQARDANGATANSSVEVQFPRNDSNTTYRVCLSLIRYSQTTATQIDIILEIMAKISYYLGDGSRDSLAANNYSIIGQYPRAVDLCFSNCSLGNKRCDNQTIESMRKKIYLKDQVVRPEFMKALAPGYVITRVTEFVSPTCFLSSTIRASTIYVTSSFYSTVASASMLTTSLVKPTPVIVCSNGNNKPQIINSVKRLSARIGQPIAYLIASDVAYDAEDGSLKNMQAKLTNLQGKEVTYSWIYLDNTNKTIYISYLKADKEVSVQEYQFRLVVTDSCGASVYDIFKVEVFGSIPCCYVIQTALNISYGELSNNVTSQSQIYQRIRSFYNDTQNGIQLYSIQPAMIQNRTDNSSSVLIFTNSSLTNNSCNERDIDIFARQVLYANGTVKSAFLAILAPYAVTGAKGQYNKHCNATAVIIPPLIPVLPVPAKVRTFEDWLWYILPFIILAFLLVLCCFLFYWCKSCCEACRGGKKAKGFDPFSGVAARPLGEDPSLSKAAAVKAAEAAAAAAAAKAPVDEPAVAALAAQPLESSTDPIFDDIYAHIAPTASDLPVPSLHRDKKPKSRLPSWNLQAAAPDDTTDGPATGGVAAQPNKDDQPTDDVEAGVAALSQGPPSEDPVTANVAPMFQTQPQQSSSPSTSMFSSENPWMAAPVAQSEDPITSSMAAMPQSGNTGPRPVTEDAITPTQRPGTQAAPPPRLLTQGRSAVTETITTTTTENQYRASAPGSFAAPSLRLPSTPVIGPNEPPPPYSPPKTRQSTNQMMMNQTQSINQNQSRLQSLNRRVVASPYNARSSQRILRPIKTVVPLQSAQDNDHVIIQRSTDPRQYRRQSRPTLVLVEEATPKARPRLVTTDRSYKRKSPRIRAKRPSVVVRRPSASPTRQKKRPVYIYAEPQTAGSDVNYRHVSPRLPKHRRSLSRKPSRKSRKYEVYLSDTDSDMARNDKDEVYSSVRQPYLDTDIDVSDATTVGKPVPIEIQGVFKAPEKVLRKWFKESAFASLANSLSPKARQRESKQQKSTERGRRSDYLNFEDEAGLGWRNSSRNKAAMRRRRQNQNDSYSIHDSEDTAVRSSSRSPSRSLKRGYPYSKDPYEYVETALKARPERRSSKDLEEQIYLEKVSKGTVMDDVSDIYYSGHRLSGRRPRKNVQEILSRLSRRKQLKKRREAVMNNPEA